jgi:hypothetical protein
MITAIEWVDATKRLPSETANVLFLHKELHGKVVYFGSFVKRENGRSYFMYKSDVVSNCDVAYWAYLPKTPEF